MLFVPKSAKNRGKVKEIKEIIDMGRRLDELAFDTYSLFAKRDDFDKGLVNFWTEMAEWKKNHLKHWKKISKSFVYRNFFNRSGDDLKMIIKQLKNIQAEQVEFMRRLRKKKVSQDEAISQTILNEFCLITDIFLEIFYVYDETIEDRSTSFVEECEAHLVKMANTLKPYLRLNPLYAVLLRSIVDLKHKYDYLLSTYRKMKKAAV
jgi:gas vesicle protein